MRKHLLKTIYSVGGFAPFHRANRGRLLILMYHRFSREVNPYTVSGAQFSAHLEYLKKYHSVLSLSDAADCLQNNKKLPPNAAVITIDDGYADAYEIAFPILKKYDLPAVVYAVTDFLDGKCWLWTDLTRYVLLNTKKDFAEIEFENEDKIQADLSNKTHRLETANRINSRLKKLPDELKNSRIKEIAETLQTEIPALPTSEYAPVSWEQAREMDVAGVRIESHTVSHPILTNIDQEKLDFEMQASKQRLEKALDKRIEHFCYPNGNFDEAVRAAAENAGYKSAVTTRYGFNEKNAENLFLLNRIDAHAAIENFAQSASGFEKFRQRITNSNK